MVRSLLENRKRTQSFPVRSFISSWETGSLLRRSFTELWAVLAVPLAFVFINTISLKVKLIPAMERNDNSLGTVYYAISLVVLSGVSFILKWPQLVFIGVLVLAYGDGLAALIGQKYGKKSLVIAPSKTLAGSLTVLVVAFVVTLMTQG